MTTQGRTAFAEKLLAYRKSRRLTQRELAEELGCDPITLSRYERDASPIGIPWLADDLERLTGEPPPRTRAELDARLEALRHAQNGRGASRGVLGEASAGAERQAPKRSKRRPPGQERA